MGRDVRDDGGGARGGAGGVAGGLSAAGDLRGVRLLWLAEYPRGRRDAEDVRYALKMFAEEFERVRLSEFDRMTARAWALRHPQSNVRVVRAMFNDAINDGLHPGPNPFANLRLEQSRGRKDLVALTEEELDELAERRCGYTASSGRRFGR